MLSVSLLTLFFSPGVYSNRMNTPPTTTPVQPPPSPPGPTATREEWRNWRHARRDAFRSQYAGMYGPWGHHHHGWFFPLVLVLLGTYWLLLNVVWPALLILCGLYLLTRRLARH